ncbi:multicopper oxidase domain-containing protein [Conexibacter woesei]|uniref:Multicopper oxidase type 2 n=1 Tax=Conexibacter woesei (strain DSM 14684 / CCUG 47730 / CIP 108061 / JCM 11494 / NBRC 100937 / ID131577) TaxID=469383 RepID=D3F0B2_CONWI|nr:multicopper oxidase domain-containing protein [Conexibacter woesei]ADB51972.1 multicopper oxidase type 2 [Conexibacter woesei DSM 14684]
MEEEPRERGTEPSREVPIARDDAPAGGAPPHDAFDVPSLDAPSASRFGGVDRRGFLALGGTGALFCTLAASGSTASDPKETVRAVAAADKAAAKVRRPRRIALDPRDKDRFPTPQPQPGGRVREYWVQARSLMWDWAPSGRDEWMDAPVPKKKSKRLFRAFVYQLYSPGYARPIGPAAMPGPTLHAEVGDTIVVHLRNADEHFRQAITMHPHGVKYNPDYDGSYFGPFTRVGGFIAPDEEFTYTWECPPDSVGVWPYHDHGPNHTLNTFRGLFGAIVVREKGAKAPDVEEIVWFHSLGPEVTGLNRVLHCMNGYAYAGNTPTFRAKVGQDVAFHVIGGNNDFHTFHIHGHRWRDSKGGAYTDTPTVGPFETITARFTEDNPGRWMYHCHVMSHQDAGMAGWYIVDPA